jgi:phage terminase large subunit
VTDAALAFAQTAQGAGCPADQVRNFLAAGIVLQPRQLAFAAACRACDFEDGPTQIGFGGARHGGKSHTMLSQLGADDCIRYPGLQTLMLRKVGASGRESFESLLPKTIGRLGTYIPSGSIFRVHNGSTIRLGHFQNESDIDKYLGLEYGAIAIEEGTTLTSAKENAVRSCCRATEGCGWRARTYFSTNPGGVGHAWFKARFITPFRRGTESDTRFIPATAADNKFTSREYHAYLDGLTGWLRRAWRDGDWDIAAGQYFTTFRESVHRATETIELPSHWRVWLAMDYGFTHYTVFTLLAEDGDGHLFILAQHAEQRWLVPRHVEAVTAMCARRGVPLWRLAAIVAGLDVFAKKQDGGTIADDYAAHGFYLIPANDDRINGAAEVLRRLGDSEANIPPSILIDPSCVGLIECLPSLEHDEHRPEDVLKVDTDENGLGGDDWYDSFRYGLMYSQLPSRALVSADDPYGEDVRW